MQKTDRLERIHTMVRGIRQKKLSETEKLERIEKFFDRYFVKYKDQISFLMGNEVDIHDSISAHDAQHKAIQYLKSYKGVLPDTSTLQEEFVPLKIDATEIGSVHSDSIEAGVIQKYANDIMLILGEQGRKIDREKIELSFYDTLTGISNRAGLIRNAKQKCNENEKVSVVGLDLDYFKKINDELGHDAGDEALRFFANRLSEFMKYKYGDVGKNTGSHPFYGRYGGEEFLIVLPGLDRAEAILVAGEFVDWMRREPVVLINSKTHKKVTKTINISAGVATHDPKKPYKRALNKYKQSQKSGGPAFPPFLGLIMQHADVALMLSKIYGRDQATHYLDQVSIPDNIRKGQAFKKKLEDRLRGVDDIDKISRITNSLLEELEINIAI